MSLRISYMGGSILEPMKGFLLLGHFQKSQGFQPFRWFLLYLGWEATFPQKIHPKPQKHQLFWIVVICKSQCCLKICVVVRILNIANTEGGDIVYDTFIDWAFNSAKVRRFSSIESCNSMHSLIGSIFHLISCISTINTMFGHSVFSLFSICVALHAMAQYLCIPYDGLKRKCPSLHGVMCAM